MDEIGRRNSRKALIAVLAALALLVPAIPLLALYFADGNQDASPDGIVDFSLAFPASAAVVLTYAVFVFASPGLRPGTAWRHGLAIPIALLAGVVVLVIASLTLLTKGYFPSSD